MEGISLPGDARVSSWMLVLLRSSSDFLGWLLPLGPACYLLSVSYQ